VAVPAVGTGLPGPALKLLALLLTSHVPGVSVCNEQEFALRTPRGDDGPGAGQEGGDVVTGAGGGATSVDLEVFEVDDDSDSVDDFYYRHGWSDGLPLVPPTRERVDRVLAALDMDPDERVGPVPVSRRIADIRSIVVNAVLAGCRAEHVPAVVALLRATLEPEFNLAGVQATTHPCAPLAVFGGPIVDELPLNCGAGLLGPGTRANAVIGRALRLILMNIGEGTIGNGDKATFGQPGKFSFVAAENSSANPWSALREDHGRPAAQSAVTVFAAEAPHNVNDHGSSAAEGVLVTIAGTLATLGNNNIYLGGSVLVAFGPEHAALCAREGMTKADVRNRLFELSRIRVGDVWWENRRRFARIRPDPFAQAQDDDPVAILPGPEHIEVTVFGGPGRHSMIFPTFGASVSRTAPIEGGSTQ
jgi:hypothetical protein